MSVFECRCGCIGNANSHLWSYLCAKHRPDSGPGQPWPPFPGDEYECGACPEHRRRWVRNDTNTRAVCPECEPDECRDYLKPQGTKLHSRNGATCPCGFKSCAPHNPTTQKCSERYQAQGMIVSEPHDLSGMSDAAIGEMVRQADAAKAFWDSMGDMIPRVESALKKLDQIEIDSSRDQIPLPSIPNPSPRRFRYLGYTKDPITLNIDLGPCSHGRRDSCPECLKAVVLNSLTSAKPIHPPGLCGFANPLTRCCLCECTDAGPRTEHSARAWLDRYAAEARVYGIVLGSAIGWRTGND